MIAFEDNDISIAETKNKRQVTSQTMPIYMNAISVLV